jgi:hypothetical protein
MSQSWVRKGLSGAAAVASPSQDRAMSRHSPTSVTHLARGSPVPPPETPAEDTPPTVEEGFPCFFPTRLPMRAEWPV